MIKKLVYITGISALLVGAIIAIGVYIRDINFGPMAQLVAITGLFIVLFGIVSLWICHKGKAKYKNSSVDIKTNELVLQLHGYQIKFSGKHLFAFLLIFLILSTSFAGYLLLSMEPINRLNLVGPKAVIVDGVEVVMPFPMTVTIDDTGWRYSYISDEGWTNNSRPHVLEDYENLVYIGKQVGTRLMCAFIISDFDETNICAGYPTTTPYGRNWNNTPNLRPQDEVVMQYIRDNSAYIEYGLHGVRHGMFSDGYLIEEGCEVSDKHAGEWYDIIGNKPWNFTAVQNHAYVFNEISRQYNLSFPKSMVPPMHGYYYNPSSNESTSALLSKYGLKYATTDFNVISELHPKEGIDQGVLLTHRMYLGIRCADIGAIPQDIVSTASGMSHFTNFYAEKPENNRDIAEQWILWFNKIKDNPYRYVPKNNAQLNSQWLYCKYTKITKGKNNTIIIDNSRMPVDAYTYDLIGNLVLKIPLSINQHVSEATIDGEQVAGYYEDRGYGYIILPILNRSIHTLSFKLGSTYLPTYILNDGTYNVFSFNSTEEKVELELEMYGTQDVKIKMLFEPEQILSSNPDVIIQSHNYDSESCILSIRLTASDVQGEKTTLIITHEIQDAS